VIDAASMRENMRKGYRASWDDVLALLDELEKAQRDLRICGESYDAMTKGWLATCAERDALRAELETARAEHKTLLAGFSRLALDNAKHWIERDAANALLREVHEIGWGVPIPDVLRASITKHLEK
jgi:hypothetical protein